MPRSLLAPSLAILLAACASSPQAAPPAATATPQPAVAAAPPASPAPAPTPPSAASAAGVYDFRTSVQGMEVTGVVTVTMTNGTAGGTISTSATPDVPIRSVTVDGQTVTVSADSPDGDVTLAFVMSGQDFTGTWWYGGQSGSLSGRKR